MKTKSKLSQTIICFDFETTGLRPDFHEVIEIAARAYNALSLEKVPDSMGGVFYSLLGIKHEDRVEDGALRTNKRTIEEIRAAPDPKLVWERFVTWINQFNPKGSPYMAPIACGKNIRHFDLRFAEQMCVRYCPKKEKTVLFSNRMVLDLEDEIYRWLRHDFDLDSMKLEDVARYFGYDISGLHGAMRDTEITGELMMRFLRLYETLRAKKVVKWRADDAS